MWDRSTLLSAGHERLTVARRHWATRAARTVPLYPILKRLESEGLLRSKWSGPASSGKPPRHTYRLTRVENHRGGLELLIGCTRLGNLLAMLRNGRKSRQRHYLLHGRSNGLRSPNRQPKVTPLGCRCRASAQRANSPERRSTSQGSPRDSEAFIRRGAPHPSRALGAAPSGVRRRFASSWCGSGEEQLSPLCALRRQW